jgi:hypothetical protein
MKKSILAIALATLTLDGISQSTSPCLNPPLTWYLGGNNLANGASKVIGTCTNDDFILQAYGKQSLFVKSSSWIGIGQYNNNPTAQLDVSDGSGGASPNHMKIFGDALGAIESNTDMNLFYKTGNLFQINEGSYTGSWYPRLHISPGGNIGIGTSLPTSKLTIDATGTNYLQATDVNGLNILSGTAGYAMAVHNSSGGVYAVWPDGRVAIGHTGFATAKLNVNVTNSIPDALDVYNISTGKTEFRVKSTGYVYAREINVQLTTFPDYVFDKGYKLRTIGELDQYIRKNKKLPGFENAEYYEQKGMGTSEMLIKHQEKIEELTLYIIELEKRLAGAENAIKDRN